MNILIVGDSWAARDDSVSWVNLLRERVGSVKCLAEGASSLFYSYMQLKKEDLSRYDYVIVIVTNLGRLYFPDAPHINCHQTAKIRLDHEDPIIRLRAHAALQYYEHLDSIEVNLFMHAALIAKIRELLATVPHILQPVVREYDITPIQAPVNFHLLDIRAKQLESIPEHLLHRVHAPGKENLINHMSPSNNRVLCDFFYDVITKGSSNITINHFNKLEDPIDQWFPDNRHNRLPSWVSVF